MRDGERNGENALQMRFAGRARNQHNKRQRDLRPHQPDLRQSGLNLHRRNPYKRDRLNPRRRRSRLPDAVQPSAPQRL